MLAPLSYSYSLYHIQTNRLSLSLQWRTVARSFTPSAVLLLRVPSDSNSKFSSSEQSAFRLYEYMDRMALGENAGGPDWFLEEEIDHPSWHMQSQDCPC